MQEHSNADENYYLTAAKILDICKRAVKIFESSEPNEKRQFLNFLLQNGRLRGKDPVFTLKPVFAGIVSANNSLIGSEYRNSLERLVEMFRKVDWSDLKQELEVLNFQTVFIV